MKAQRTVLAAIALCLASLFGPGIMEASAQSGKGVVPHGSFEDSNQVRQLWRSTYGELFFEDSISIDGERSLGIRSEGGHIDLFIHPLELKGGGTYEFSFWYRAKEGHQEDAPFWIEVTQNGRSIQVFRTGSEKARMRKLHRDWILYTADLEVLKTAPLKLYIHSDLPCLWIDDLSLERKD